MQSRSGKTATEAERRRFQILAEEVGCIACLLEGRPRTPADLHHPLSGGRRQGTGVVAPLCPWHHRGVNLWSKTDAEVERILGPSLARTPRQFRDRYGSDEILLDLAQKAAAKFEGRFYR